MGARNEMKEEDDDKRKEESHPERGEKLTLKEGCQRSGRGKRRVTRVYSHPTLSFRYKETIVKLPVVVSPSTRTLPIYPALSSGGAVSPSPEVWKRGQGDTQKEIGNLMCA